MLTDDDVLVTRWDRWRRRVSTVNLDAALRITLLMTSATMALAMIVMVVQTFVQTIAAILRWF